jgi:predicted DNA-binding transcriptional regulator AlpA
MRRSREPSHFIFFHPAHVRAWLKVGEGVEILTAGEVAAMLKISKRHVYELTQERYRSGDVREHPLPALRFGSSVRFRRSDVEGWIERLVVRGK